MHDYCSGPASLSFAPHVRRSHAERPDIMTDIMTRLQQVSGQRETSKIKQKQQTMGENPNKS